MIQNDIDGVLDHLRRIKSGANPNSLKIDKIVALEIKLRTFFKYQNVLLHDLLVKIKEKAKLIVKMLHTVFDECKSNLNLERLESQLLEFIEGNTSIRYNYELKDSYLPEYMDCLGKNLNDVLMYLEGNTCGHSLTNRFIKKLKIVQRKMRFLRNVYVSEINGSIEHEKLEGLETRIQFMADNVGHVCFSFWVCRNEEETDSEETDEEEIDAKEDEEETDSEEDGNDISRKPPYLLFLVVLVELEMQKIFHGELKASKFTRSTTFKDKILPKGFSYHLHNLLVYLRNEKLKKFPTNVNARNIDVAIEFLLVFLGDVPNHVINGKRLNKVLANIGVLVGDILCVTQKMCLAESSTIKEEASKIDLETIHILEKIEDLKAQEEERYKSLKYSPSNELPTVGGLSFLDSLLRKLNEMLKSESSLDFLMKPHIGNLEKELSSLTSVFRDVAKVQHKHDEILKDLQRRAVILAYEAEVSIDSILVKYNAFWHSFCSLPAIIEEINHINVEVTKMRSVNLAPRPCFVVEPSKHLPPQHSNLMNDEEIVGFEDDTKIIIQHLTRGTSELDVIPIVGMGGQGKTTCAKMLYNNDIIVSHFDVRAWCIISQTYNRIELLQDIFSQVTGSKGDKDDVLAEMLKKKLMGKRYLIVLDDMWDGMAWDDLRLCFPDVGNRSRIVLTTRLEEVAKYAKHHTDPYSLPLLKPDESLKLLQTKVFQQEGFPPELQDVSQAVAERCKGLPLVIILAAGIIKRKKMEVSWWDEVKNSLLSYLGNSEGYSLSTMQLSYNNLPDYLKPCLLYMGMFPEDAEIPVSKLMSLWIAEDFVQNIESGRLIEEAAEGYLTELISSNVVMVSKREYNGKVKYCQVHDVVLHFCLEKSREEKFMLAVKGQYQPLDWKGSRVRFSFSKELSKFASLGSKTRKPLHQHLRSLITTNGRKKYFLNPFCQVSKVRLLKVLDLSSFYVFVLSSITLKPLIHLKYLAVNADKFHFHPESHLLHLETLIVEGLFDPMVLPANFWKMGKLRHVDVSRAEFDKQGVLEESPKLQNLRILRGVIIINADRVDVLYHKFPNLQELDIYCSAGICFKWECLTQLQILHLTFNDSQMGESYPVLSGLQLLSSLKKLVLKSFPIHRSIPFIAGLPSLEYLQINNVDLIDLIESEEWCLGDITFHKLKLLKLSYLGISRWDASEESFPLLEKLVIKGCVDLEEIPLSFADIPTLKQIKLIECKNESLEASAAKIKQDVEENEGNDRIDLIIKEY